jgi:hypothetical protein
MFVVVPARCPEKAVGQVIILTKSPLLYFSFRREFFSSG